MEKKDILNQSKWVCWSPDLVRLVCLMVLESFGHFTTCQAARPASRPMEHQLGVQI